MTPANPKHAKTRSFPREYVEDFFGPRTTQMSQIVCRSRMALLGQTPRAWIGLHG
jgi:hypothetical protein